MIKLGAYQLKVSHLQNQWLAYIKNLENLLLLTVNFGNPNSDCTSYVCLAYMFTQNTFIFLNIC